MSVYAASVPPSVFLHFCLQNLDSAPQTLSPPANTVHCQFRG